ncbi:MAG: E3 binding domain-containing protein [Bacteroidetes bacterium]|nr:E3 binding domain-containing protein [Bacteroidota bacterium]
MPAPSPTTTVGRPSSSSSTSGATSAGGAVKAMPVVRKLAKEHGVDLATLTGTGPGGTITRDDVLAATATGPVVNDREEPVQMRPMRRMVARAEERKRAPAARVMTSASGNPDRIAAATAGTFSTRSTRKKNRETRPSAP